MKQIKNSLMILLTTIAISWSTTSCDKDKPGNQVKPNPSEPGELITLEPEITEDLVLTADKQYLLNEWVYVREGATLTIEPGAIIKGEGRGTLFIDRGAKIIAKGTATAPIVFTSAQPAGKRVSGDWGGIVILGRAPVNKPEAVVEGENTTIFGGDDATDNSGVLKYVRIEFAGIALETDKEINSLTLGGVGSGTEIDFVQVSYANDDAFEWFGGAVNAKHLVSFATLDDDLDSDNGFSGNVQFGYIIRDPQLADVSKSNGLESDNDSKGTDAQPQTSARFANITLTTAPGDPDTLLASALHIRRNSAISVYNSLFTGAWTATGLLIDGDAAVANFNDEKLRLDGVALAGIDNPLKGITKAEFIADGSKNMVVDSLATLLLPESFNSLENPNALPQEGSPLLNSGAQLPEGLEQTEYIGAFGTEDWTADWTNFDPQNTEYALPE